jgi:hypothetical protein
MEGRTLDWPSGLAYKIVQGLQENHTPVDQTSMVEYNTLLEKVHMKKGSNPKELFAQLMMLQCRFGPGVATDSSLIEKAIHVAPQEYRQVIT